MTDEELSETEAQWNAAMETWRFHIFEIFGIFVLAAIVALTILKHVPERYVRVDGGHFKSNDDGTLQHVQRDELLPTSAEMNKLIDELNRCRLKGQKR